MKRKTTAQQKPTDEMLALLRATGSPNKREAMQAMRALAQALEVPLRQGVVDGNIIADIFTPETLAPGATAEYPLDFYQTENVKDFTAYTVPGEGMIPLKGIYGDMLTVPTYDIADSIDWALKYSRNARWNIVARAMEILEASFQRKLNRDGFHALLAAGVDRGVLVYDADAAAGQFTKRLISLMKTQMRRLAGGNSASVNRGRLTDLYISPEAMEDIRNWDEDEVDEITRRDIMVSPDGQGTMGRIYEVNLHDLDELGEDQEFQNFFDALGGTMGASDTEVVIGLDLGRKDSFVMPIKEELQIYEDANLHRSRRAGFYAWQESGFGVLDNRRVLLGSL